MGLLSDCLIAYFVCTKSDIQRGKKNHKQNSHSSLLFHMLILISLSSGNIYPGLVSLKLILTSLPLSSQMSGIKRALWRWSAGLRTAVLPWWRGTVAVCPCGACSELISSAHSERTSRESHNHTRMTLLSPRFYCLYYTVTQVMPLVVEFCILTSGNTWVSLVLPNSALTNIA